MNLIISSKGIDSKNVKKHFVEMLPNKKELQAIIITTASSNFKELNKNAVSTKSILESLNIKVSFLDIEFEKADILLDADIIYINGGNPYYLLHHIYKSKTDFILKKALQNNIIIIGSSAGGLVLSKSIDIIDLFTPEMNFVNLKNKKGLNFLPEIILPHYDTYVSTGKIDEKIVLKYEKENNILVTKVNDDSALIVKNGERFIL